MRSPLSPFKVILALLFALVSSVLFSTTSAKLINEFVSDVIQIAGTLAHHEVTMHVRNSGSSAENTIDLVVNKSYVDQLALSVVVSGSKITKPLAPLPITRHDADNPCCIALRVAIGKPLAPSEQIKLFAVLQFTDLVRPVPPEIAAGDPQYFRFTGSAYFLTPYDTARMETTVKTTSSAIASYSKEPRPVTTSSGIVKFGPYENVPQYAVAPISLRYRDESGVFVANRALRQMYVSHWGNIFMKEEFEVENAGAKHVGRWSRVDYTERRSQTSPTAIGDVWANLPAEASNVFYKDLVGNITTSRLRESNGQYRPMQLEFRFPLLGGWKNHFWYTYDVPLNGFSKSHGNTHVLRVPVFTSINERFLSRKLVVRILLPEGSSNIQIEPHPTISFAVEMSRERTSLSYFGRPVVTLTAENVFSTRKLHPATVRVSFDSSPVYLVATPLIILTAIFGVFLVFIIYKNTNFSLVPDEDNPVARTMLSVSQQQHRIAEICMKMDSAYNDLDGIFELLSKPHEAQGPIDSIEGKRMETESKLKEYESELSAVADELRQLGSSRADLSTALSKCFSNQRNEWMRAISARRMLTSGEMRHEEFQKLMDSKFCPSMASIAVDIDKLVLALTVDL